MSEATIGGLVILAVLGLVIAWALVGGGARCDGYIDDPDNWRADGARDDPSVVVGDGTGESLPPLAPGAGEAVAPGINWRDRALSDAELHALSAGDNPRWLPKEGRA